MLIKEIAKRLNKSVSQVQLMCIDRDIHIYNDPSIGEYVNCTDADKLLVQEIKTPTRYTKHGRECKDIIKDIIGSDGVQNFYIGNIIKYIYRNQSIGDLEKARTYLDMLIDEVKNNDLSNK